MSPKNGSALTSQAILQSDVALCDTLERQTIAAASVESQSDGVTPSSKPELREFPAVINRLPDEILSRIFHLVHEDRWITRTALDMGGVCMRWRHIITGTGSFWTDVRADRVDLARLGVERSQKAELEFTLSEFSVAMNPLHVRRYGIFPETAVNLLIASIGRIRQLVVKLHSETYSALLPRLAPFTAPLLKALDLNISEEGFIEDHTAQAPFHVAQNLTSRRLLDAPSLAQLSVQTLMLRGALTIYPNINSLSLHLGAGDLHNSSFILGTMRAHAQLTELRVAFYGPLFMREHDIGVQLLRLKSLSFEVGELEDAGYFLHRMDTPELSQVELDLGTRYRTTPATTASRLAVVIKPLLSTIRETPTHIAFDHEKSESAQNISLKEHPWSQPTLAIRLRGYDSIDKKLIRSIEISFAELFPHMCTASSGGECWPVCRHIASK